MLALALPIIIHYRGNYNFREGVKICVEIFIAYECVYAYNADVYSTQVVGWATRTMPPPPPQTLPNFPRVCFHIRIQHNFSRGSRARHNMRAQLIINIYILPVCVALSWAGKFVKYN